ncbi:MAG TPA: hypothetical protein VGC24_12230, partial [Burkholderiaceae bacterium]
MPRPALICLPLLAALHLPPASAQWLSVCASDGVPAPTALLERFISADCADCWSRPPAHDATAGELALDWIVPGRQGEDAPLSAAATRDATERLAALRRAAPAETTDRQAPVRKHTRQPLRVAYGTPI